MANAGIGFYMCNLTMANLDIIFIDYRCNFSIANADICVYKCNFTMANIDIIYIDVISPWLFLIYVLHV